MTMSWDPIEKNWHRMTSELKVKWAKLTDDDLASVAGKREQLIEKVQQRYAMAKPEAERTVNEWMVKISPTLEKMPAAPDSRSTIKNA